MQPWYFRFGAVAILLVLTSCSRDGRLAVDGSVTLDGEPLSHGAITFQPARGAEGHSAGGQLVEGRFHISAANGLRPGKYSVTVQSFKLTGRMIQDPQRGKVAEQVLVAYKEAGKIEVDVDTRIANHFDIQLTSPNR